MACRYFVSMLAQVTVQVEKGSKEAARIAAQETKKTAVSGLDRFLAELDKKKKARQL